MAKVSLQQELMDLEIIKRRGKLKEQLRELVVDKPWKELDMELKYMEQIREEHFSWNDQQCQQYAENQKASGKIKEISEAGDQLVSLEAQEMKYLTPIKEEKAALYAETLEDEDQRDQSAKGKQIKPELRRSDPQQIHLKRPTR